MAAKAAKKTEKPVTETTELVPVTPSGGAVMVAPPMQTNLGVDDMKRPLLKVIQGLSPEVEALGVSTGQFFATVLNMEMGKKLTVTVLGVRKRYVLWNPQRNVEPMILAASDDGVLWNEEGQNKEFSVKIPNVGMVKWKTGVAVADTGLHLFGSSVPGNKDSKPAAAETFDYLLHVHDEEILPVGISMSRSKLDAARSLNTICFGNANVDPRGLKIKLKVVTKQNAEGQEYFNIVPMRAGKLEEAKYREMVALAERFKNFSVDLDLDENREGGRRQSANVDPSKVEY